MASPGKILTLEHGLLQFKPSKEGNLMLLINHKFDHPIRLYARDMYNLVAKLKVAAEWVEKYNRDPVLMYQQGQIDDSGQICHEVVYAYAKGKVSVDASIYKDKPYIFVRRWYRHNENDPFMPSRGAVQINPQRDAPEKIYNFMIECSVGTMETRNSSVATDPVLHDCPENPSNVEAMDVE